MLATIAAYAFAPSRTPVEDAAALPARWTTLGAAPRNASLELIFAVKQSNVDGLHDTLMAVSTPSSPQYGKHLTNDQVHELVAPIPEHIAAVEAFASQFGATARPLSPNRDLFEVAVPIEVAERMLQTTYSTLRHNDTGVEIYRITAGGYTLPPSVAAAVDFVAPTVHVPGVRRAAPPAAAEAEEAPELGKNNVPKSLRKLYSVGLDTVGKAAGNKQAVTAFLGQKYAKNDLQKFWKTYCGGIECGKGLPTLVGDATTGSAGVESMLDIETITGVAGNVDTEFWGYSGRSPDDPENEPFMKWLAAVAATSDADVPKLFSTSYGSWLKMDPAL